MASPALVLGVCKMDVWRPKGGNIKSEVNFLPINSTLSNQEQKEMKPWVEIWGEGPQAHTPADA